MSRYTDVSEWLTRVACVNRALTLRRGKGPCIVSTRKLMCISARDTVARMYEVDQRHRHGTKTLRARLIAGRAMTRSVGEKFKGRLVGTICVALEDVTRNLRSGTSRIWKSNVANLVTANWIAAIRIRISDGKASLILNIAKYQLLEISQLVEKYPILITLMEKWFGGKTRTLCVCFMGANTKAKRFILYRITYRKYINKAILFSDIARVTIINHMRSRCITSEFNDGERIFLTIYNARRIRFALIQV